MTYGQKDVSREFTPTEKQVNIAKTIIFTTHVFASWNGTLLFTASIFI